MIPRDEEPGARPWRLPFNCIRIGPIVVVIVILREPSGTELSLPLGLEGWFAGCVSRRLQR
jgi:hypothetical protein